MKKRLEGRPAPSPSLAKGAPREPFLGGALKGGFGNPFEGGAPAVSPGRHLLLHVVLGVRVGGEGGLCCGRAAAGGASKMAKPPPSGKRVDHHNSRWGHLTEPTAQSAPVGSAAAAVRSRSTRKLRVSRGPESSGIGGIANGHGGAPLGSAGLRPTAAGPTCRPPTAQSSRTGDSSDSGGEDEDGGRRQRRARWAVTRARPSPASAGPPQLGLTASGSPVKLAKQDRAFVQLILDETAAGAASRRPRVESIQRSGDRAFSPLRNATRSQSPAFR